MPVDARYTTTAASAADWAVPQSTQTTDRPISVDSGPAGGRPSSEAAVVTVTYAASASSDDE